MYTPEDSLFEKFRTEKLKGVAMSPDALELVALAYESGFIDGMQKQMQSSVDRAVNRMAEQPAQQALDKMAENARELRLDYEPQRWAVFCQGCRKEWSVSYPHPGKDICADCDNKPAQYSDIVSDGGMDPRNEFDKPAQQEPVEVDQATMELAESVGLIGPASRTHDLHCAIQRFHDLICVNATIKAAKMAADAICESTSPPAQRKPLTDEQITEIAATPAAIPGSYVHSFARAIEAAHGIKENT